MNITKLKQQPWNCSGVLFLLILTMFSCNQISERSSGSESGQINFVTPVDSGGFEFSSPSLKTEDVNYSDNRYGSEFFIDKTGNLAYFSIDSEKEIHRYNIGGSEHSYSEKIIEGEIEGFRIEDSTIYILADSIFYVKNHGLQTLDSFNYLPPKIENKYGIDFSTEVGFNLFKVQDFYGIIYYEVDSETGVYGTTDSLFYLFNADTAFFTGHLCPSIATSFQYFRYPCLDVDNEFIYHAPKVGNCISKTRIGGETLTKSITDDSNRYLDLKVEDQYQISLLKKYRYTTDYNRKIMVNDDNIFLVKEFLIDAYQENKITKYNRGIEVVKFDKDLSLVKTYRLDVPSFSHAVLDGNKLIILSLYREKFYVYEV